MAFLQCLRSDLNLISFNINIMNSGIERNSEIAVPISVNAVFLAATLNQGGAIQASVSFILNSLSEEDINWTYVISKEIKRELDRFGCVIPEEKLVVVDTSPAKSLRMRRSILDQVNGLNPDVIFSFFGPSYIKFAVPHLMGVADGWVTHSNRMAYQSLVGPKAKIKMFLQCLYKGWWYRQADAWVVEAECAKQGLRARCLINQNNVHIVSNTCSSGYYQAMTQTVSDLDNRAAGQKIRILTMSAYYPHKKLEIIPQVCRHLIDDSGIDNFEFVLTLPHGSEGWAALKRSAEALNVAQHISSLGHVAVKDGPSAYLGVDVVFLPSVLETFSANYPEAMAIGRPIVTSGLDFAKNICQDAAVYFKAGDPKDAAHKIALVIGSPQLRHDLIKKGRHVLSTLPDSDKKYLMYKAILLDLARIS